ncbi:MAG: phosphotransferase family protein [Spirochaetaceae bacterium]
MALPSYALPNDVTIISAERDRTAEMNSVYRCEAKRSDLKFNFYLKVTKGTRASLQNELETLETLHEHRFPVPRVLWHGVDKREFIALEEVPGVMLRDFLKPYSPHHRSRLVEPTLRSLGTWVGKLHRLSLPWRMNMRTALYSFLGEEELEDLRFREIVLWLQYNPPPEKDMVFVHGDLNDANALVSEGEVTGILDWEAAGHGWREYELAWILRERRNYMNTEASRDAFLDGYTSVTRYDEDALRWCEVMNCLHVAFWCKDKYPNFMDFNLAKAREAMFAGFD